MKTSKISAGSIIRASASPLYLTHKGGLPTRRIDGLYKVSQVVDGAPAALKLGELGYVSIKDVSVV